MPLVHHLRVASDTELWVVGVELLVAEVEEVALWVVEGGVNLSVDLPVSTPELPEEVWASLTGELAVEDEDLPSLLTVRPPDWRGGEC